MFVKFTPLSFSVFLFFWQDVTHLVNVTLYVRDHNLYTRNLPHYPNKPMVIIIPLSADNKGIKTRN